MYGYIYKTTNLINSKIYIGQHKSSIFDTNYVGSGKYFRNALKKYGRNIFYVELLERCDTKEILNEREKYYIQYYRKLGYDMYNIANGGEGGDVISGLSESDKKLRQEKLRKNSYFSNLTPNQRQAIQAKAWETRRKNGKDKLSEESRKKMSSSHKGCKLSEETKQKISKAFSGERHPLYGTHRSEETKRKISLKAKGRNVSDETRAKLHITNSGVNNGFYGKTHSADVKRHIGEKSKEWYSSNKVIWINNGTISTRIPEEKFLEYEQKGYKKGRLKWQNP